MSFLPLFQALKGAPSSKPATPAASTPDQTPATVAAQQAALRRMGAGTAPPPSAGGKTGGPGTLGG